MTNKYESMIHYFTPEATDFGPWSHSPQPFLHGARDLPGGNLTAGFQIIKGPVTLESEKGVGTTFVVTVTLLDSARVESEDVGELHPNDLSVLVIDDDPIACEHAQVVLGQLGISCDKALDGAEGVEMAKVRHARRDPYDLIPDVFKRVFAFVCRRCALFACSEYADDHTQSQKQRQYFFAFLHNDLPSLRSYKILFPP